MTYTQFARALTERLFAICPKVEFVIGPDWNNKDHIKRSLRFPDGTADEVKESCRAAVDSFEGFFVQSSQ